jgi:hypothetical protein
MKTEQHITEWPVGYWIDNGENQKFLEFNKNENATYQYLWDT